MKHTHNISLENLTTLSCALKAKINHRRIVIWQYQHLDLNTHLVQQISQVIWQFEHMEYRNIHYYSNAARSAKPLQDLKNTAVE